jgi:hypothetical protein
MVFFHRSFSTITVLLCAVMLLSEAVHALWPLPRNLQTGSDALRLDPSFAINVAVPNAPEDLLAAAQRTCALLFSDNLGRLVIGRGADDLPAVRAAEALTNLTLYLIDGASRPIATEATLPLGSRDEAYSLVVPADGSGAVLSANSTLGLFRGLTTFGQLWYTASGTVYTLGAPVAIQDSPAYVRPAGCGFLAGLLKYFFLACTAVSRVHARHSAELVCDVMCALTLGLRLTIDTASRYQTSNARSMRCPGFTCVDRSSSRTRAGPDGTQLPRSIRSTGTSSTARASPSSFPASPTSLKMARTAHLRSIPPKMSRTSYITPARCVPSPYCLTPIS